MTRCGTPESSVEYVLRCGRDEEIVEHLVVWERPTFRQSIQPESFKRVTDITYLNTSLSTQVIYGRASLSEISTNRSVPTTWSIDRLAFWYTLGYSVIARKNDSSTDVLCMYKPEIFHPRVQPVHLSVEPLTVSLPPVSMGSRIT